jgi:hypothetical protein
MAWWPNTRLQARTGTAALTTIGHPLSFVCRDQLTFKPIDAGVDLLGDLDLLRQADIRICGYTEDAYQVSLIRPASLHLHKVSLSLQSPLQPVGASKCVLYMQIQQGRLFGKSGQSCNAFLVSDAKSHGDSSAMVERVVDS